MGRKHTRTKKTRASNELRRGSLDVTKSGMGYVVVDGMEKDVMVRPGDMNRAFHGDKVSVRITTENFKSGRLQGVVEEVLERKQTEFIGQIEVTRDFAFFLPDAQRPMPDFFVAVSDLNGARDGDRVAVKLVDWRKGDKNPRGIVASVLTGEDENEIAMKELIVQHGFLLDFTEDALEETERIPEQISEADLKDRRDMRDVLTFTIDPVDARDFDDALSIREIRKNLYEIGVHIADVSHYIESGTALDQSAYGRATSVYLPDRVVPMLPERISNELCSLRPHEDKLTYACVFEVTNKAEIKNTWIGRTVIHSNHRFTYEDVQTTIETQRGLYQKELSLLNDLAQRQRKERFKKGAINFSSQEVRFKLDEKGKPVGIVVRESKESHQLIEEFMLLANRAVAQKVAGIKHNKKDIPFAYRVHDQPDEEKLIPFMDFARKFGHHFDTGSPEAIASSFNKMLAAVKGMPEQHVLEQLGIRTMAKAVYSPVNIGHYGLGFEHYCHFTSPIRRYPDILVHRILTQVLRGKVHPDKKMSEQCRHCSEKERSAMEAERAANKYKQVEYMRQFLGDEFDAVISGVASFGFWAETVDHKCEGLVSTNSLLDYDDFRLIESDYALVGRRSGRAFRMGDRVRIRVVAASLAKRQLDYEWIVSADGLGVQEEDRRKKKNSRKR